MAEYTSVILGIVLFLGLIIGLILLGLYYIRKDSQPQPPKPAPVKPAAPQPAPQPEPQAFPSQPQFKTCHHCKSDDIPFDAIRCKHCGGELREQVIKYQTTMERGRLFTQLGLSMTMLGISIICILISLCFFVPLFTH